MKRVFFSLVVMCIMTTMTAQTKYELWSVSSGEVKDNNGEVLKRGVVIPETQELCVPKGTTVTFVNSTTKTVYKFKPDENEKAPVVCKTVKNMINKKSNAFLFQIMTQVYNETKRAKKHKSVQYSMPGGASRGYGYDMQHQSIYLRLKDIASAVYNHDSLQYNGNIALLKDKTVDECTFIIENRSMKQDYVVNILAVDMRTGAASLCLEFPSFSTEKFLVAEANQRLILDDYCLIDSPDIKYILFATTDTYDSSVIQSMLLDPMFKAKYTDKYSKYIIQQSHYVSKNRE